MCVYIEVYMGFILN